MGFPERVETDRLVLRRPRERDRGAWLAIWADPSVWPAISPDAGPDPRHALARFEHHLDHWERYGFGLWMAEERATRTIAGRVGAAHPDFVPQLAEEAEIGWALRRPFWGRGLATEAATVAIEAAFAHLPGERVISLVAATNRRSIRVAERLGMTHDRAVVHPRTRQALDVYALRRA